MIITPSDETTWLISSRMSYATEYYLRTSVLQRAPAVILSAHIGVSVVAFCYGRRLLHVGLLQRCPLQGWVRSARLIFVGPQQQIQTRFDKLSTWLSHFLKWDSFYFLNSQPSIVTRQNVTKTLATFTFITWFQSYSPFLMFGFINQIKTIKLCI